MASAPELDKEQCNLHHSWGHKAGITSPVLGVSDPAPQLPSLACLLEHEHRPVYHRASAVRGPVWAGVHHGVRPIMAAAGQLCIPGNHCLPGTLASRQALPVCGASSIDARPHTSQMSQQQASTCVQAPLFRAGSRVPIQRSRHCISLRPGTWAATAAHLSPCTLTACISKPLERLIPEDGVKRSCFSHGSVPQLPCSRGSWQLVGDHAVHAVLILLGKGSVQRRHSCV